MLNVGYCTNSKVVNSTDQYLPVNTDGMENTHICRHFASLENVTLIDTRFLSLCDAY